MIRQIVAIGLTVALGLLHLQVALAASSTSARPVGQVIGVSVLVGGLPVPSGTTLLHTSSVQTTSQAAVIHLNGGPALQLSRNSSAFLQKMPSGIVQVEVRAGTLSFRRPGGEVITVPAPATLTFPQRHEGWPLIEQANKGQVTLKVNDASKIDAQAQILVKSRDGKTQEVHHIESIKDNAVKMTAALVNSYAPQDLVIQGESVKAAIAGGAVVGGAMGAAIAMGTAAGAGAVAGGLSTATIVGILAGAGAAHKEGHEKFDEEKTKSPSKPPKKEKDECKNGGWKLLFRADGTAFKNQGDCIQYVNTGK